MGTSVALCPSKGFSDDAVALVPKTGNKATTADQAYEIVPHGSAVAEEFKKLLLKETEKVKYLPGTIVSIMKAEGYDKFSIHWHRELWRNKDGKNPKHQYGVLVEKTWFWYESWVQQVRTHCQNNATFYRSDSTTQGTLKY